jgi:hypothetical protein
MRERNRKRLSKLRRDLTAGAEPFSDLIDVHRRLVEVAEELRRTDNRTRVLALEAERKVMVALGELIAAADLVHELEQAEATNRELAQRLTQQNGGTGIVRADQAPAFIIPEPGEVQ